MLLQTNSYVVPKERRAEHQRLLRRFRQTLARLGCEHFEVYEQVGANWTASEGGRYVQIMRFRDRRHQMAVQSAERRDPGAQAVIAEFCNLINFPYQQQQGLFAVGFYQSALPVTTRREATRAEVAASDAAAGPEAVQDLADSAGVEAEAAEEEDLAISSAADAAEAETAEAELELQAEPAGDVHDEQVADEAAEELTAETEGVTSEPVAEVDEPAEGLMAEAENVAAEPVAEGHEAAEGLMAEPEGEQTAVTGEAAEELITEEAAEPLALDELEHIDSPEAPAEAIVPAEEVEWLPAHGNGEAIEPLPAEAGEAAELFHVSLSSTDEVADAAAPAVAESVEERLFGSEAADSRESASADWALHTEDGLIEPQTSSPIEVENQFSEVEPVEAHAHAQTGGTGTSAGEADAIAAEIEATLAELEAAVGDVETPAGTADANASEAETTAGVADAIAPEFEAMLTEAGEIEGDKEESVRRGEAKVDVAKTVGDAEAVPAEIETNVGDASTIANGAELEAMPGAVQATAVEVGSTDGAKFTAAEPEVTTGLESAFDFEEETIAGRHELEPTEVDSADAVGAVELSAEEGDIEIIYEQLPLAADEVEESVESDPDDEGGFDSLLSNQRLSDGFDAEDELLHGAAHADALHPHTAAGGRNGDAAGGPRNGNGIPVHASNGHPVHAGNGHNDRYR